MRKFKEIKTIASAMAKIRNLAGEIDKKYGEIAEGVDWTTAEFVSLTKEDIQHFKAHGNETENYFVDQNIGYLGDDFYGYVYFATDVPGQYVKVCFEC